jgi:hypothetical protein
VSHHQKEKNIMRRIQIVSVVALSLAALIFAYSQAPQPTTRPAQTATKAKRDQVVKAKKVLVTKLPKGLRGIELKDGQLSLMPGYKFEKKNKNTIAVALKRGSGNAAFFHCVCQVPGNERGGGACLAVVEDENGWCIPDPWDACSGECFLVSGDGPKRVALAIF